VQLRCDLDPNDRLVVHLREGDDETSVSVSPARAGATTLGRATDAAAGVQARLGADLERCRLLTAGP
jgi:hypothetical protein